MKILVTGNQGYIGSKLTALLTERGHAVTGLDTHYYEGCAFEPEKTVTQVKADVRTVNAEVLRGQDVVIHLAALSNDPVGALNESITDAINFEATVRLAELAKKEEVPRFVYASSCSLYGMAGEQDVTETAPFDPKTAYAASKVKSEDALRKLADDSFSPVYMRPGTAYGIAPMLRCDVVVNNLVGWAVTTGKIVMMSDGTPWRPVVHVEDFASAFVAAAEAEKDAVHNEAFNVGQTSENYQIKALAEFVKSTVPNCELEFTNEHGSDTRTYTVNFDKIATKLPGFKPKWTVQLGIKEVYEAFTAHGLTESEFTSDKYTRVKHLKQLLDAQQLDADLFWLQGEGA